ncbi:hypothetical protein AX769_13535 [Frondihabitans sp. PAMC 28766]|uniref:GNAT family N-acetyltransferase n=1 Tax=Frondihabitans sp. PAMC 28766 TaxID=1795630 RepID=UPI00078C6C01|nr:GNAT family protein [Frondihabitans sp. PAMC 28766]AMM20968.1 hypothetical protein AX769_13535 [Frondihabitans sp. PAMC 28766]
MTFFSRDLGDGYDLVLRDASTVDEMFELTLRNIERLREWEDWAQGEQSREANEAFSKATLHAFADGTQLPLALRHDGRIIGAVGLRIDSYSHSGEIGYWLDGEHEGRGAMARAVEAIVEWVFADEVVPRLEIRTATANARSRRLAERLGFRLEGELKSAMKVGDARHDVVVYARLADA